MCCQAREAAIEIVGLDVDAVEQRLTVEVERQGYNGDGMRCGQLSWQVRRRVGDDGHGWLAQWCSRRSMIGGSSCLRFQRLRMNRSSTGLIATSITTTRSAVKIAIA